VRALSLKMPEFQPAYQVRQHKEQLANAALITSGSLGCSPQEPAVAYTLEVLEIYHQLRRHQPSFSIQAMTKVLCALNGVSLFSC
jgi:hypothetical protein